VSDAGKDGESKNTTPPSRRVSKHVESSAEGWGEIRWGRKESFLAEGLLTVPEAGNGLLGVKGKKRGERVFARVKKKKKKGLPRVPIW